MSMSRSAKTLKALKSCPGPSCKHDAGCRAGQRLQCSTATGQAGRFQAGWGTEETYVQGENNRCLDRGIDDAIHLRLGHNVKR